MHELWTRQMNFVKLQQNSFLHSVSVFFLILLLSSFILKLGVLDAIQVPKPSNEIKSKDHVRWVRLSMEKKVVLIPNGL